MQNRLQSGGRGWDVRRYFSSLSGAVRGFTYIGNDMIQPGMLAVVEQYQAGADWVPTSMTALIWRAVCSYSGCGR